VEFETPLFEELPELPELPHKRCIDLEYLLLSLPSVREVQEASTSLGEDIGADAEESLSVSLSPNVRGGRSRIGKFTGRRRL
jgi:hypothetical protein